MEAVAASKMKKAQETASTGQSYERLMHEMTEHVMRFSSVTDHPLLNERPHNDTLPKLTILIASDRGLCGSLPANVFRLAEREIPEEGLVIAMGRKAVAYAIRTSWVLIGSVERLGDRPTFADTLPASSLALREYEAGHVRTIQVVYPKFVNTLIQRSVCDQVLPFTKLELTPGEAILRPQYIFEPGGRQILDELIPAYVRLTIYQAVLSMKAAEHSARMVAMKHASENAEDVQKNLVLQYNQNRQQQITTEIADIVTAGLAI